MFNKKNIALLLVACLLMTLLVACNNASNTGGEAAPAENSGEAAPAEKSGEVANLILATGGTTGTYYSLGGTIAQLFNSKLDNVNVTAQSTGASIENCRLLETGEAEIALLQNDTLDYGYNGTDLFDAPIDNLRGVAALYPEIIQIVGSPDIKTITDLAGKKVSVGAAGSGTELNARQALEAAGLTYDDLAGVSYLSFDESANAYKDGQVDAFFVTAGVPNASIQDITAQHDINIIAVDSSIGDKLIEKYPFYIKYTIPGGTYSGVDSDVETVAVLAVLATSAERSEDEIYNLTKTLFENLDELAGSHAKGAEISLEKAIEGISIPFHPGAEKYYKEAGVLK